MSFFEELLPLDAVGFIAELDGNEDHLILADPVVRRGDSFYRAVGGTQWNDDQLRRLKASERKYVSFFKEGDYRTIKPGEAIWLAGCNFMEDLCRLPKLAQYIEQTKSWGLYLRGYRWTVGSPRKFEEFQTSLETTLTQYICGMLADPMEKTHGHADPAFRVYSVLNTARSADRELTKALYFFEQGDKFSFDLTVALAVDDGLFPNESDFWEMLAKFSEWAFAPRASDQDSPTSSREAVYSGRAQRLAERFREMNQMDAAERSREMKRKFRERVA